MLRIIVELVPDGDPGRRRELGRVDIVNVAPESMHTGNYAVTMDEFDDRIPGRRSTFRTTAALSNVERDIVRPMQLVGMVLGVVAPVKRTMHRSQQDADGVVLWRGEV